MFQRLICRTFLTANIKGLLSTNKHVEDNEIETILKLKTPVHTKRSRPVKKDDTTGRFFWLPA